MSRDAFEKFVGKFFSLASWELFAVASQLGQIGMMYSGQQLEKLKKSVYLTADEVKELVAYEEWEFRQKLRDDKKYFFDSVDVRKKLFEAAGIEVNHIKSEEQMEQEAE